MNKKSILAAAFMMCLASVNFTSCGEQKEVSPSIENSKIEITDFDILETTDNNDVTDIAESDGNTDNEVTQVSYSIKEDQKITFIEVTDSNNLPVTDKKGAAVTEAAILDNSGNIVTNAAGQAEKPVTVIVKTTESTQKNNNADNVSNNNATTTSNNTENNNNPSETAGENNNGSSSKSCAAMLWIAGYHYEQITDNDGNPTTNSKGKTQDVIFEPISGTSDVISISFTVNSNAKPGIYDIVLEQNYNGNSSSFCGMDDKYSIPVKYISGKIGIGMDAGPNAEASSEGSSLVLSSASNVNPGDTVTIYGTLTADEPITGFNIYVSYDDNTFSCNGISAAGAIAGKGDFISL